MKILSTGFICMLLFCIDSTLYSQSDLSTLLNKYQVKTQFGFQFWGTYTMGQDILDDIGQFQPVEDRLNFMLRRSRINLSANPHPRVQLKMTTALDFVGRDVLSATQGANNNSATPLFGLWNLTSQWKAIKSSEALFITVGYMPVNVGRSSTTGAWGASTFEKSWTQNYVRRATANSGPGRTMGLNLGGLLYSENKTFSLGYDLAIYSPVRNNSIPNTTGITNSPLKLVRTYLNIGDPEKTSYGLGHKDNYYGERRGLTIAGQIAWQGASDLFTANQVYGLDWLLNYDQFNLDGEWLILSRKGVENGQAFTSKPSVFYARASYNIVSRSGLIIQPAIMLSVLSGDDDTRGQERAASIGTFSGSDKIVDIALNFHFQKDLRFTLAYTINSGSFGQGSPQIVNNNYYLQPGFGRIKRGNLLGMGLIVII